MSLEISISRRDVYTTAGAFDASLYEIQTNESGELIQVLQLESAEELLALRDALSEFIGRNNLTPTQTTALQP